MGLKRIGFNKRSVIVTWLISYISVLLVPIMISGIIYVATWHVVESEVNRANESLLQQMEQAIDNNLGGIERLSVEMTLSKRLAAFINAAKPLTDNDYYELVSIADNLRVYKVANDFIEQIYIYYKNSDTVISTRDHINTHTLYETIREKEETSYEEWKAFFDKRYIQEYAPITIREDGKSVKAVMYAKSIILDNLDLPGAVILFVIKDSKLLQNITPANKAAVAVLDKENRLIASTGFEHSPDFLTYERLSGNKGMFYDQFSGEKLAVSYTTSSSSTGWKYVSMIPAELFDEKMKYIKTLIYVSLFLSLLSGGIVTFLFLRKNYNPISLLIRSLSLKSGISFDEGSNEYGYLQEALNNTFAEKEKIDQRLQQNRDAIRSHFLQGLLKGRLEQNVPIHESLAAHDIRLVSSHFAVLLFHIDHYGKFESDGYVDPQKMKLVQFIIMNVVEELATEQHCAFTTEMDDMQVCIINFSAEPEAEELNRISVQVRSFLLDHFHVHLTVAISGIHQDLYGISLAYQETLAALEYRLVMGSGEIIRYGDLPNTEAAQESTNYYFPLQVEQQLINFVKTGDYEKSNALIEEIIEINLADASLSAPLAKCLMFDLISTMLKTMDEIGINNKREFTQRENPIDRLIGCETIKEMKVQISEVLSQVCRSIQENRGQEHNQLSQQVIEYVKQHYSSENLNISMIGEVFGLTPSYLSKQFKAQTGEALLDFINKKRLEEAKKLLSMQTYSIVEISKKVGYSDINTFNRIFKKFEGITPGKYKGIT
ncbi:helix-turn-helix domain-containing protein [Paenibacillus radicis (ex Xue et al. 2023)]|uniref:Helix-turn-helix domain-containing protein n=1 Tax=Paenibacillus radicis (ex Xue et al. 2023) TaxID=2972489 RepID=A0ABT1YQV5_9BACL|nr:helix-turn-helix domain-containing protein [Paenibacillus radicis (ex Xue et al. 2023)]MCR8635558.1 helix-turn-helix domain-containing protein [Paenibacillus radicis (ex Xue et al. 2023)]